MYSPVVVKSRHFLLVGWVLSASHCLLLVLLFASLLLTPLHVFIYLNGAIVLSYFVEFSVPVYYAYLYLFCSCIICSLYLDLTVGCSTALNELVGCTLWVLSRMLQ